MSADLEARLRRIEDRQEIEQLRARYCHLLDDCAWPEFIALFTEDGVFQGLKERIEGREALMQFFSVEVPKLAEKFWHFCTNGTVEIDGDTATGRITLEYLSVTDGVSYVAAGHYDDVLQRVDGQWRFKSRIITWYYLAPLEQGWAAGTA